MTHVTVRSILRGAVGAAAMVVAAIGVMAQPAEAGGLRNCVDIPGKHIDQVGCWENVWVNDQEVRMTFSNVHFSGATAQALDRFYVLAPQTDTPQGPPPAPFAHDHVVRDVPAHNTGDYSTRLQGYFVVCSGEGIVTGACVPTWMSPGGPNQLPFATTVNGRPLTSTAAIESAAEAGLVALINLGPDAVLVGRITGR